MIAQEEGNLNRKWLPVGLASQSPAAPSSARLPTLQLVISKANAED